MKVSLGPNYVALLTMHIILELVFLTFLFLDSSEIPTRFWAEVKSVKHWGFYLFV
jgi:hypothetical protein